MRSLPEGISFQIGNSSPVSRYSFVVVTFGRLLASSSQRRRNSGFSISSQAEAWNFPSST